jgi:hypothetical protein
MGSALIAIAVFLAFLFGLIGHTKRHFPELLITYEHYPDGTILSVHPRALFKKTWKWYYTPEGVLFKKVLCYWGKEDDNTEQMYYPSGKLKHDFSENYA